MKSLACNQNAHHRPLVRDSRYDAMKALRLSRPSLSRAAPAVTMEWCRCFHQQRTEQMHALRFVEQHDLRTPGRHRNEIRMVDLVFLTARHSNHIRPERHRVIEGAKRIDDHGRNLGMPDLVSSALPSPNRGRRRWRAFTQLRIGHAANDKSIFHVRLGSETTADEFRQMTKR